MRCDVVVVCSSVFLAVAASAFVHQMNREYLRNGYSGYDGTQGPIECGRAQKNDSLDILLLLLLSEKTRCDKYERTNEKKKENRIDWIKC